MKRIIVFIWILSFFGCKTDRNEETFRKSELAYESEIPMSSIEKDSIKIDVYDFKGFENFLKRNDGKTYVINFWATWCAPCVKELPYFEKLQEKYKVEDVEVILVSLDMPKMYETKLIPFIKERNLTSKVIALDDPRQNTWIPKVDENWSGAIPATYIYKNNNHKFVESSLSFEELEELTLNIKSKKQ
ncbi:TlpA disulfide reductase family protein [Flavobacteriaceae bacterium M23B6Z8]